MREAHQVLSMLRERVRRSRNASTAGLGEQSAGVLVGFLVADIMRRAVGPQSELTADEFRSMVLMPGSTIARVVGSSGRGTGA